jgi:predicted RND superfamily exporter protein
MDRLYRAVTGHPWIVIAFVAAITVGFGVFAMRVRIDSSVEALLDHDDPETRYYDEVKETFGTEEVDVVALVTDDVFTPATLTKIKDLSDRLLKIRGVADVTSLATVRRLTVTPEGSVDTSPLMEAVPDDAAGIARLKQLVYENPLFVNNLVGTDGTAAALAITYDEMSDAAFAASGIHAQVERLVAEAQGPERLYLTGTPTLKTKAAVLMKDDLLTFMPLIAVVVTVVLLVSFRTLRGVLLPLATIGTGMVWTLGFMGYLDAPISIGTLVLPPLVMAVGSAYATHIVSRYYEEGESHDSPAEVAFRIIRHLGLPVFVTAFTTVLGFASLLTYHLTAIRHLGTFSVFGVSALFTLALFFTSAVLALLARPRTRPAATEAEAPWLRAILDATAHFDVRHRRAIIVVSVIMLVVFGAGVPSVRVETDFVSYFPEGSPVREASRVITERLGGSMPFLVVIDGPEENAITRLDALQRIAALQDFIARLPGVDQTTSIVDYVKLLHRVFHDNDPAYYGLPDTNAAVQQYLLLLDPSIIATVVSGDYARAAIIVRSHISGSTALAETVAKIRRFAADAFPVEFSVHPTGTAVLLNRTSDDLSQGQMQSLALAMAVVFSIMSLMFLSFRFGLVAMVPNLIPIVIFFGLLGWTDTPLSISTVVIASIALGLGVDEAIHLMSEFNHAIHDNPDQERAVLIAMQTVGPPVIYTTGALFFGFLVPAWSNFVPVRQFGILSSLNVATSLLADLLLLPALLVTTRFVTLWDVLAIKLGGAPHETIPLFHGLRPGQARVAALMGVLRTVEPGQKIVGRGEPGDSMYVLIRGRAEARNTIDGRVVVLASMERGDVIGEMGLLRKQPRSADVVALEPTELLVVNDRFLRVLRQRFPRIASTVFFNLTHILSNRLERADEQLLARAADPARAH